MVNMTSRVITHGSSKGTDSSAKRLDGRSGGRDRCREIGGPSRNRTGVQGFAVLCVTTPPSGLAEPAFGGSPVRLSTDLHPQLSTNGGVSSLADGMSADNAALEASLC